MFRGGWESLTTLTSARSGLPYPLAINPRPIPQLDLVIEKTIEQSFASITAFIEPWIRARPFKRVMFIIGASVIPFLYSLLLTLLLPVQAYNGCAHGLGNYKL